MTATQAPFTSAENPPSRVRAWIGATIASLAARTMFISHEVFTTLHEMKPNSDPVVLLPVSLQSDGLETVAVFKTQVAIPVDEVAELFVQTLLLPLREDGVYVAMCGLVRTEATVEKPEDGRVWLANGSECLIPDSGAFQYTVRVWPAPTEEDCPALLGAATGRALRGTLLRVTNMLSDTAKTAHVDDKYIVAASTSFSTALRAYAHGSRLYR